MSTKLVPTSLTRLVTPGATCSAVIVSVTDGDTLRCDVTLGELNVASLSLDVVARNLPVRLDGCNAWESSTDAGKAARANLRLLLPPGTRVTLSNIDAYKYGLELVASVKLEDGQDLVSLLVQTQWAAPWSGLGARPVPPWPRTMQ